MLLCVFMVWPTKLLQLLWIMCKLNLLLENLWRMQEILFLGILGLKSLIWKSYHLILTHFLLFWVKSSCFSKIVFFLKNMVSLCLIQSVHSVFRPIEIFKIFFKIWERSLCLFRPVKADFRPIETRESGFLKSKIRLFQSSFQIVLFFSLSPCWL